MADKKIIISQVDLTAEPQKFEKLLWDVLWEPLSFLRDIREKIKFNGDCIELTAAYEGKLVGGLVAYWTTPAEIEIRHITVLPEFHGMGVGSLLIKSLLSDVSTEHCTRIYTIARNTSMAFFKKLEFSVSKGT
jgi:N-acetylglutamate synthase-like GNAT family acetyltransferase